MELLAGLYANVAPESNALLDARFRTCVTPGHDDRAAARRGPRFFTVRSNVLLGRIKPPW